LGRHQPYARRLRYSPRLGAKTWIGCRLSGQLSAERLAERGTRNEPCERRVGSPGACRGRTGFPKPSNQVPTVPSRSGRPSKRGGDGVSCKFCLLCDKFSLDHDRLAVMHQPIDHGSGQCVVHLKIAPNSGRLGWWKPQSSRIHTGRRQPGTTYLHRVCRWEDNPVPDRGEKALKTTNKV
jgi:hypothetical protein